MDPKLLKPELGVLEGGAAALKAAEMTFEDAVATGDAVAIENAALVLSRLVQGASPFELSQDADKVRRETPNPWTLEPLNPKPQTLGP